MSIYRWIISLLLFTSTRLLVTSGQIVSGPSNVAAAIGSQTYFNCTATSLGSEILLWQRSAAGSYEDLYSSNKPDTLDSAFGIDIDSTNGHYNLIVKSVALDLGTKYWCTILSSNTKYYGELVAVDQLLCPSPGQEVTSGDVVIAPCSVSYSGYMSPKLTWTSSSGHALNTISIQNTSKVESYVNFTADSTYDMVDFTCSLTFSNGAGLLADSIASNIPTYTAECSTYYIVKHGVTEIMFEPAADANGEIVSSLSPGDHINCTSDGRPQPAYTWRNVDGSGNVETNQQLAITSDMAQLKQPITYECTATNNVNGVSYSHTSNVTFTVVLSAASEVKSSSVEPWVIAVAVVVPVVVIVALIVGFCICSRRRAKNEKGSKASAPFINATPNGPPPVNTYAAPRSAGPSPYAPGPARPYPAAVTPSGYGDIGGQSLGASANRIYTPVARPQAPRNGSVAGSHPGDSSMGSRVSTPSGRPAPTVSMLPDPRAAPRSPPTSDNPNVALLPPPPRPPSVTSSTMSGTSTGSSTTRGSGYNFAPVNGGPPSARPAPPPAGAAAVGPPTAGSRAGSRPTSAAGSGLVGPFHQPPPMAYRPDGGSRSPSVHGSLQGSIV